MCLQKVKAVIGSLGMLVLSRQRDETVIITVPPSDRAQQIFVSVIELRGVKARLGFAADRSIRIHRQEVEEAIKAAEESSAA